MEFVWRGNDTASTHAARVQLRTMLECTHETQTRVDEIPQAVARLKRKLVVDRFELCDRRSQISSGHQRQRMAEAAVPA